MSFAAITKVHVTSRGAITALPMWSGFYVGMGLGSLLRWPSEPSKSPTWLDGGS